jgi:hypothetical protein
MDQPHNPAYCYLYLARPSPGLQCCHLAPFPVAPRGPCATDAGGANFKNNSPTLPLAQSHSPVQSPAKVKTPKTPR